MKKLLQFWYDFIAPITTVLAFMLIAGAIHAAVMGPDHPKRHGHTLTWEENQDEMRNDSYRGWN